LRATQRRTVIVSVNESVTNLRVGLENVINLEVVIVDIAVARVISVDVATSIKVLVGAGMKHLQALLISVG
jgi:hypothetical protein